MSGILSRLLGSAAAAAITDAYFNLVTLLLNTTATNGAQNNTFLDSSTNNFSITRNGNTTQGTFTPFSQTGWSNYFSSSASLSIPSGASVSGTGNFTVEMWIFPIPFGSSYQIMYANDTSGGLSLGINSTGTIFYGKALQSIDGTTTGTVTFNSWNHIAFVRSGTGTNQMVAYINGSSAGTFTNSTNYTSGAVRIANDGGGGGSGQFNSYISNLRTGTTAVYSSSFTPSTTPLTAITGTTLLACQSNRFVDNSTNAYTITVAGSPGPSVQAFSPFLPTAAYDAAVVGGSGYFDGTGDSLSCGTSTNLALGSGDWTVEFWLYQTATGSFRVVFDWRTSGGTPSNVPIIGIDSSQFPYMESTGGTAVLTSSIAIQTNSWSHVTFSRLSGTLRVFVNGASGGSVANSTNFAIETLNMSLSSAQLIGYVSGARIIKGTGYSSITVPTAPPTAITNTQLLLNYTNAGIFDSAAKNDLETVGNAQVSTTVAKWGTTSMYFDGTGDYLYRPYSVLFPLGTGDFTIEWWMNPDASQVTGSAIFYFTAGSNYFIAHNYLTSYQNLITVFVDNYGAGTRALTGATSLSSGTWYHVAITRASGTWRLFVNGSLEGSTYSNSAEPVPTNSNLYIGQGTSGYKGYLDDFRISKYARYTANFTAPTAAFPLQ